MVRLSLARRVAALVSSSWLQDALSTSRASVKVLETAWQVDTEAYQSCHIPGAQPYDLARCVTSTPHNPRTLPALPCFEQYMQQLGVRSDQHLILYDRNSMTFAARAWWTMRVFGHQNVSVLDGSLEHWQQKQLPTQQGPAAATEEGNFSVGEINKDLVKSFEDMVQFSKRASTNSSQILDARKLENFLGSGEEPSESTIKALSGASQPIPDSMLSGHIAGSVHLLTKHLIDEDTNCMLCDLQLAEAFAARQIDLSDPVTTVCYNGFAACVLALAAAKLNKTDVAVYDGSWTEYGQRATADQVVQSQSGTPVRAA